MAFEKHGLAVVENATDSPEVNRALVERAGLKSVAFVPLESERRMIGVVVGRLDDGAPLLLGRAAAADQDARRRGYAGARANGVAGSARAGSRSRAPGRRDLAPRSFGVSTRSADRGRALRGGRRLSASRAASFVSATRDTRPDCAGVAAEGLAADSSAERDAALSVSKLALRERRTAAVADVETAPSSTTIARRAEALLAIGVRAVLAAPIIFFGVVIGVLAAHSTTVRAGRTRTSLCRGDRARVRHGPPQRQPARGEPAPARAARRSAGGDRGAGGRARARLRAGREAGRRPRRPVQGTRARGP